MSKDYLSKFKTQKQINAVLQKIHEKDQQKIIALNAFIDRAFKDFSKMNKQKNIYNPL